MMSYLPFTILYLARAVHGTSANTTSFDNYPPPDITARSIWSILGSCALTLVICVWQTIHFDIPQEEWRASFWFRGLWSFFVPERLVASAATEWWSARNKVDHFHREGYEWSMTHSFFAEMGGFRYYRKKGFFVTIKSLDFLELCKRNEIANPAVTVKEITALSKSDALGKAIFVLQLLWFTLQVVVRISRGLSVTLIELDTVCMAILSLSVISLWWDKPLCPESPIVLYYLSPDSGVELYPRTRAVLSNAWVSEPGYLDRLVACITRTKKRQLIPDGDEENAAHVPRNENHASSERNKLIIDNLTVDCVAGCSACTFLGVLHVMAWDFDFPTDTEKITWRVASLFLVVDSPAYFGLYVATYTLKAKKWRLAARVTDAIWLLAFYLGAVLRAILAGLMLASLRALPSSAYQTVSWTVYIPHL